MDSDGPGQEAVRDLVERLGRERCRVVNLPLKDANACLMQDVPRDDMLNCLRDSKTCDPSALRNIGAIENAIWRTYSRQDEGRSTQGKKSWRWEEDREGNGGERKG